MEEGILSSHGKQVGAYITRVLGGMAQGLFASLIIGLILKQIGHYTHLAVLEQIGQVAQYLTGAAIGLGVAYAVKAPALGLLCSAAVGAIGAGTFVFGEGLVLSHVVVGEPVGAMLAALAGAELAKRISGKTGVDIILVPLTTLVGGALVGYLAAPPMASLMRWLGSFINALTQLYPLPMGILVSTVVGMILTLPISSAAICISLGLDGLAAGAAAVGCSCQMIGFAVISYRENRLGGLISQGLGTSMLQIPNIAKNPLIWIPPTLTSALLGPVSTMVFKMENNSAGAGMGTSGLVGQFNALAVMGLEAWPTILLMHILLPALLSSLFSRYLRKKEWIKEGDLLLKTV
ncbi:MAG: PTS sugar transporter subunit IIC [Spirochaetia bacterium]|nr:PTS sugar transporter subunit IIC [Spirochaetia bacterium]